MLKTFVTKPIPGNFLTDLKNQGYEVSVGEPLEKVKGYEALLTLLTDRVDGDLMDLAGPTLKIISNYAVGFDNIDVTAATERGIVVTNTPSDEVNVAVSEHTWALTLSLVRRVVEADEAVRRGAYKGWEPDIFIGKTLKAKTLGIVGLGRIGTMVARIAKGFGVGVVYNKRSPEPEVEKELGIKFLSLDELLKTADIVSLHVPLTLETKHLINKETIAKMKAGSYLINTARGPVVDENALVEALRSGHLAGAALDVFDNEPKINPELIGLENVVLTPHIASATREARDKMGMEAIAAIVAIDKNEKPENIVNPDVWEKRRK